MGTHDCCYDNKCPLIPKCSEVFGKTGFPPCRASQSTSVADPAPLAETYRLREKGRPSAASCSAHQAYANCIVEEKVVCGTEPCEFVAGPMPQSPRPRKG
jgi:hypothetical protein